MAPTPSKPRFYFRGGQLALDFINTVGNRFESETSRDYFQAPADLMAWAKAAKLKPPAEISKSSKPLTTKDLKAATELRESLFRLLRAHVQSEPVPESDLAGLNRLLRKYRSHSRLQPARSTFNWSHPTNFLDWLLSTLAHSAAELLTSPALAQLRMCAGEDCGWLFLDRSRSHPRKWCSMADCGNRAKAHRHYQRIATL